MPEHAVDIGSRLNPASRDAPESAYAWTRLFAALSLATIGSVGLWSVLVALPAVPVEFGVARSAASRRYFALVPPSSRHGRGHHRERQLPRGNGLAARRAALSTERGLAADISRMPSSA